MKVLSLRSKSEKHSSSGSQTNSPRQELSTVLKPRQETHSMAQCPSWAHGTLHAVEMLLLRVSQQASDTGAEEEVLPYPLTFLEQVQLLPPEPHDHDL